MTAAPSISVASLHSWPLFFFFNKIVLTVTYLFILLFLAALGLVARRFSLVAASRGLHSRCRPLIAVASLFAEHRL